jgi:hypothetical protein
MIFLNYLGRYEKLLQERYEISTTIWHKGERGRQRENGLLMFLREMLPAAYGVGTGEIIPFSGDKPSPQCDIIIYDGLKMPIFGIEHAVQQVPIEGVYAVIETKSVIDSKAIADARGKFAKIRNLPRVRLKARMRKDFRRGPLFILFGYRFATTTEACRDFAMEFSDKADVEVVVLEKGLTIWLEKKGEPLTAVFLPATEKNAGFHETLAIFLAGLLSDLQSIDLGVPNFMQYIGNK